MPFVFNESTGEYEFQSDSSWEPPTTGTTEFPDTSGEFNSAWDQYTNQWQNQVGDSGEGPTWDQLYRAMNPDVPGNMDYIMNQYFEDLGDKYSEYITPWDFSKFKSMEQDYGIGLKNIREGYTAGQSKLKTEGTSMIKGIDEAISKGGFATNTGLQTTAQETMENLTTDASDMLNQTRTKQLGALSDYREGVYDEKRSQMDDFWAELRQIYQMKG